MFYTHSMANENEQIRSILQANLDRIFEYYFIFFEKKNRWVFFLSLFIRNRDENLSMNFYESVSTRYPLKESAFFFIKVRKLRRKKKNPCKLNEIKFLWHSK